MTVTEKIRVAAERARDILLDDPNGPTITIHVRSFGFLVSGRLDLDETRCCRETRQILFGEVEHSVDNELLKAVEAINARLREHADGPVA